MLRFWTALCLLGAKNRWKGPFSKYRYRIKVKKYKTKTQIKTQPTLFLK